VQKFEVGIIGSLGGLKRSCGTCEGRGSDGGGWEVLVGIVSKRGSRGAGEEGAEGDAGVISL
jgi:hypothetical protein